MTMSDDFDQDPEESPEFVPEEESEVEYDEECDIDSPDYHAPNRCDDPNCLHPNCDEDDGAVGSERFPGEDIWWKTNDNWKKPR